MRKKGDNGGDFGLIAGRKTSRIRPPRRGKKPKRASCSWGGERDRRGLLIALLSREEGGRKSMDVFLVKEGRQAGAESDREKEGKGPGRSLSPFGGKRGNHRKDS